MANAAFSVQYRTLSQVPIKESKTQFSGSTGICSFRDYLSFVDSVMTNTNEFQDKETPRNSHSRFGVSPGWPLLLSPTKITVYSYETTANRNQKEHEKQNPSGSSEH